jgi:hypothetical protein
MDDIEMSINGSSIQTGKSAETCSPYGDATAPPMDVDVEEEEKDQASVETFMERAIGLPFPGALLADGTFAVEFHDM